MTRTSVSWCHSSKRAPHLAVTCPSYPAYCRSTKRIYNSTSHNGYFSRLIRQPTELACKAFLGAASTSSILRDFESVRTDGQVLE